MNFRNETLTPRAVNRTGISRIAPPRGKLNTWNWYALFAQDDRRLTPRTFPQEVEPPPSPCWYWTRRGIAECC